MATVVGSYLLVQDYKTTSVSYYPILSNSLPNPVPSFSAFRLRKIFLEKKKGWWQFECLRGKRVFGERLETEGDWELNFERERDDLDFLGDMFWVGSRGV